MRFLWALLLVTTLGLGCGGSLDQESSDVPIPTSIHELRTGHVTLHEWVVLDAPGVLVTESTGDRVFVQGRGGSEYCEDDPELVAYQGIAVAPETPVDGLVPGQRVRVVGRLEEVEGLTTLTHASITPIGLPERPYRAYCQRDGTRLASEALESVLVETAGSTKSEREPDSAGSWLIDTCLAPPGSPALGVGALFETNDDWKPAWYRARGVIVQSGSSYVLEPRNVDDLEADDHDDVCL
jgi:hypothetical protein